MIHLFKGAKRVLFFQKSWANSVTNWLLGVRSSDGSLIIKNTANPTGDGSIDLRVNEKRIMRQVREHLEGRSLSKSEIIRVQEVVHAMLDGISLKWHDKSFSVDADWIADIVKKNMIDKPGEEEDDDGKKFTGSLIAAYGGYQGEDWNYYLKAKELTYNKGILKTVNDVDDIKIG